MSRRLLLGLAAAAAAIAAAVAWWASSRPIAIDHTDAALLARGARLYQLHCASCHGANLEGQPHWTSRDARGRLPAPPHDDTGHTWHHDDEVLFEVTKFGITKHAPAGYQSDMPAFGETLNDEDIIATLAYIKSRWSPAVHEKRNAAGMN
jgi:mono/diheme cytochrome c family protein